MPAMSILLDAIPPFLLLMPGFLPLLFFAHTHLLCSAIPPKPAPIICIFVSFFGPLAALAASLGIAALAVEKHNRFIRVAQNAVQSLVELGYRVSILYLITPRSFAVIASRISLSRREIYRHNVLFTGILVATFLISIIHVCSPPFSIPPVILPTLGILAALFPVPLTVHLALSAQSPRIRRMWAFTTLLQTFSAIASVLRIPQGAGYVLSSAVFTILWGGSVITLFYTLSSVPLAPPLPRPLRLTKLSLLSSIPSSPAHVHYETTHSHQFSGAVISEDFTALRDPFASPPPVPPISPSIPRLPSPALTASLCMVPSPPPTPICRVPKPPKPKAREIKPQRRGIPKKTSSPGIGKRSSSQSLTHLSSRFPNDGYWRASESGSEDALFLSDEALLSQILLHSLTLEAVPSPSPPQPFPDRREEESSLCSDTLSIPTIRTRRDENGRRYASEEVRYSNSNTLEGVQESDVGEVDQQGGVEDFDEVELQAAKGEVDAAWWARP